MSVQSISRKLILVPIQLVIFIILSNTAMAANDEAHHQVSVIVPNVISITSTVGDFPLEFSDFVKDSETNVKQVIYTVKSNNMTKSKDVIEAELDGLFDDIDFKADMVGYTKKGGTASLTEASPAGFKVIGTSKVSLCDRKVDSGNGKLIKGELTINYKAVAKADLDAGDQSQSLTLTFTDT
jgi:hypothetical protein